MSRFSIAQLEEAMRAAIGEARNAAAGGDFPYGAVVINGAGRVIARGQDRGARDADPTLHAEFEAVRAAIAVAGPDLSGHALVSNVEPCAMCSTAAWWAGIAAVAFGLSQREVFAMRPDSMDEPGLTVDEAQAVFARRMSVRAGLCHTAARQLWDD
ncbi:MAG: nucleoside deaminase [Paracoccaceae bacterium]|nr:nucleoside deaminase [Paracoccaceae bacterium]